MKSRIAVAILLGLSACACSVADSTSGPSVVPPSPVPSPVSVRVPPTFPGGFFITVNNVPRHWAGGPFIHCFSNEAYERPFADTLSGLSGIPWSKGTDSSTCNVVWTPFTEAQHTYVNIGGTPTDLLHAELHYKVNTPAPYILHELGHILGLDHSTVDSDLMNANQRPSLTWFSQSEVAAIRWTYRQ